MKRGDEFLIIRKQGKEDSNEFITKSNDSFSMMHSLGLFFLIIVFKIIIRANKTVSHKVKISSQRFRAFFTNSPFFEGITGLFHGGVNTCKSSEFSFVFESIDVFDFDQEMSGSNITYPFNRFHDIHIIFFKFFHLIEKYFSDFSDLKIKEFQPLHIKFNNKFIVFGIKSNRVFSQFNKFIISKFWFSPSFAEIIKEGFDFNFGSINNRVSGRESFEDGEDKIGKDIIVSCELGKKENDMIFKLSFGFCDLLREFFSCSCKSKNIISYTGDKAMNVLNVFKGILGYNKSINFICFGFSERKRLNEFFNKKRVNECNSVFV